MYNFECITCTNTHTCTHSHTPFFNVNNILKKLHDTRNLWAKLNGITKEHADELDKKCDEARDKAVKELDAHLKEIFNG